MGQSAFLCTVTAAALAGLAASAGPAAAQCRLCDTPITARSDSDGADSVSLEIETSLDFDRLVVFGNGAGSATLLPNGSRGASGAVGDLSGRAMVGSATVRGVAGRAIRIALPRRIDLFSLTGGKVTIEDLVSEFDNGARLDSTGTLTFRFGGRLQVSGDAEGDYRGDVPITVEYL
ncbi:MAG: DUF4402 domain-containing protein [Sphingomicrobium sp.]